VVVFPCAYSASVCTGLSIEEYAAAAPPDWWQWAELAATRMRISRRLPVRLAQTCTRIRCIRMCIPARTAFFVGAVCLTKPHCLFLLCHSFLTFESGAQSTHSLSPSACVLPVFLVLCSSSAMTDCCLQLRRKKP
jgi:hypothetical protein